VFVKKNYLSS